MRFNLSSLILVALSFAIFAGLGGGKFFMHNRTQELGIAVILGLFLIAFYLSAFRLSSGRWFSWVSTCLTFVAFIMVFWSMVFSVKANQSFLPSFLASREFLLLLIGPTIYLLYRSGLQLDLIGRALVVGLVLTAFSYLFFYFTLDLKAAYFSDDQFTHHLVTFDEARGFRLKPPTYAYMILALICFFTMTGKSSLPMKLLAFAGLCLTVYIWSLVSARAVAAGIVVSLILYPFLWRRRVNLYLVVMLAPVFPIACYVLIDPMLAYMENAHGAGVRMEAFALAIEEFKANWLVGWGQSSAYTKTYQDLLDPKFFPSDLGIVGIMFKYGFVGALIYVIACITLLSNAVRAHWMALDVHGKPNPIYQALTVFMTVMSINIVLWPGLAMGQGLTAAGITVGLSACIVNEYRNKKSALSWADTPRLAETPVAST